MRKIGYKDWCEKNIVRMQRSMQSYQKDCQKWIHILEGVKNLVSLESKSF